MTTDVEVPGWVLRLPNWVRDDEVRWLMKRPWIAGLIKPDDYGLDPAIDRFNRSQRALRGTAPTHTSELVSVRGAETTALRFSGIDTTGIVRHVSVQTTEAGRIEGIAVPYDSPSTPVCIPAGIWCLERFDRDSFRPLPPSCPLRVEHEFGSDIGRVTSLRHTTAGLKIEAALTTPDKMTWLKRWLGGTWSSMSISFIGHHTFDDWSGTSAGFPIRTVRKAQLQEVSVVRNPAYTLARINAVLGPKQ